MISRLAGQHVAQIASRKRLHQIDTLARDAPSPETWQELSEFL